MDNFDLVTLNIINFAMLDETSHYSTNTDAMVLIAILDCSHYGLIIAYKKTCYVVCKACCGHHCDKINMRMRASIIHFRRNEDDTGVGTGRMGVSHPHPTPLGFTNKSYLDCIK